MKRNLPKWCCFILCVIMTIVCFSGCETHGGIGGSQGENTGNEQLDNMGGGQDNAGGEQHKHKFAIAWTKDDTEHWHKCTVSGCTEISGKAPHSYGANGKCICGKEKTVETAWTNALQDPNFDCGFGVKGQQDGITTVYGYFRPEGYTTGDSVWTVAQWYSGYYHMTEPKKYPVEYDVLNAQRTVTGTKVSYADESKTFAFDNKTGNIYLELNASKEYNAPRVNGGPWPHLLVEYTLNKDTRLSDFDGLQINIDYRLDKVENKMSEQEYDAGRHAAQLVWYVVVKNCNAYSNDNGKWLWFGFDLYDNRADWLGLADSYSLDAGSADKLGTGVPIYKVANGKIHDELPTVGKDISVSIDMYDIIKSAFDKAVDVGYLPDSEWSDMYVIDGNCGWELPGTFDCAATISKFEINTGKIKE